MRGNFIVDRYICFGPCFSLLRLTNLSCSSLPLTSLIFDASAALTLLDSVSAAEGALVALEAGVEAATEAEGEDAEAAAPAAAAEAAAEILIWGRMWKTRDLRRLLKVDLLVYKSQCLFLQECDNAQKKVAAAAANPAQSAAGDTTPSPEALGASMELVRDALSLADTIESFPMLIAARYQLAMMQLTADKVPDCLVTMETVESVPTPIVRFRALAAEVYFDVARRVRFALCALPVACSISCVGRDDRYISCESFVAI